MPESRPRKKKAAYTPPTASSAPDLSKPWYAPTCVALLVVGLIWVVVTYVSQSAYPIGSLGNWNLLIGFGVMMVGFVALMRWR